MADIEYLPGVEWNAHACLADAMNRAPISARLVVMWLDDKGHVKHAASATNQEIVWMCSTAIADCTRGDA